MDPTLKPTLFQNPKPTIPTNQTPISFDQTQSLVKPNSVLNPFTLESETNPLLPHILAVRNPSNSPSLNYGSREVNSTIVSGIVLHDQICDPTGPLALVTVLELALLLIMVFSPSRVTRFLQFPLVFLISLSLLLLGRRHPLDPLAKRTFHPMPSTSRCLLEATVLLLAWLIVPVGDLCI